MVICKIYMCVVTSKERIQNHMQVGCFFELEIKLRQHNLNLFAFYL